MIVPIGVYLSKYGDERLIKTFLGTFIVLFSIYSITSPKLPALKNDKTGPLFGILSGLFGGACNIAGPPAVIYATLRGWKPSESRVTLQAFFWFINLIIVSSHLYVGSYKEAILFKYFICSFPAMLIAVPIGKKINSLFENPSEFNKYVYILMLLSGLLLIFKANGYL